MPEPSVRPIGRSTIRRGGPQLAAQGARENRRIKFFEVKAKPGSTAARLQAVYIAALDAVDKLAARKVEAAKSNKFTPEGVTQDARDFAINELAVTFKRGRNAIDAAKREAAERRSKIQLQPADKTDVVGYMKRMETRGWLASMPAEQRNKFISQNRENMDPDLALAIVEMPASMTGVLESDHADLRDRALMAQHGEAIAELQELEKAIEAAEIAVETGRDEIRQEIEIADPREFDVLAEAAEGTAGTLWLKKDKADGQEIIRVLDWDPIAKTGAWRVATPEQIAEGQFFDSWQDYHKANGTEAAA